MTNTQDEWLSMGKAAALYGTTPKTLKRLLAKEQVPVSQLNRNYLVRRSDILALKESRITTIPMKED